jgi:hypothetical protein
VFLADDAGWGDYSRNGNTVKIEGFADIAIATLFYT